MVRSRTRTWIAGIVLGAAVAVALGGVVGPLLGAVTAVAVGEWLHRSPTPADRRERQRMARELPLAANLLSTSVRAGAPADRAATAVGEELGGPLGDRLVRVGRGLRLGSRPAQAWDQLSDVPGAGRLVTVAVHSAERGVGLATAFDRVADDLRSAREAAGEAAARRAGVLIMLPLGLCFLPAFVLAAVAPTVAAVMRDLLDGL
jgi:Flp pilus assembly protein TadB